MLKKNSFRKRSFVSVKFLVFIVVGIDTNVSIPCFFSICAIAPLITYFDLRLKNMFSKITVSLLYYSISVFTILLQIFLLINSPLVLRNLTVKVLMLSCCQTKVLLPAMSKEYNHLKKDWD